MVKVSRKHHVRRKGTGRGRLRKNPRKRRRRSDVARKRRLKDRGKVVETGRGKYGVIVEYEVDDTGKYVKHLLYPSRVSKKRATALLKRWLRGEI